jgi:hypothetical protein
LNKPDSSLLPARIKSAFGCIPSPGDDLIEAGDEDSEKFRIAKRFRGLHWSRIDTSVLADEPDALSFLSAAAFRFFLPGYLLLALSDQAGMDIALDSLLSALAGPVYHEKRLESLSREQLLVVLEVLDSISPEIDNPDYWDFEHAKQGVRRILDHSALPRCGGLRGDAPRV